MIPYYQLRGFYGIQPFGLMVLLGIIAGIRFGLARGRAVGMDPSRLGPVMIGAAVWGLLGAHAAQVLVAAPEVRPGGGLAAFLLQYWTGMSSFGGFFAGLLAVWAIYRRRLRDEYCFLEVADVVVQGLAIGFTFGRFGCALAHDHPGRVSGFWLAVRYPGGARHDLGLYEALWLVAVLWPALFLLKRCRPAPPPGTWLITLGLLYCPARFLLDFLRADDLPGADVRWHGLTFSQFAAAGVSAALAALLLVRSRSRHRGSARDSGPRRRPARVRASRRSGCRRSRRTGSPRPSPRPR